MKNVYLLFFLLLMLPKLFFAADQYQWKTVVIGGGGFVTGIITCPQEKNLIYARTDVGGAYRWVEATRSWKALTDWASKAEWTFLGIESIAIDPSSPNKVYMSAGLYSNTPSSILRSTNYGDTFTRSDVSFQINGNGMGRNNGERLAVDPNNGQILFCGSRAAGLWKSANGAVSWTRVSSFPVTTTTNGNGVCFVVFDETSGNGTASQRIYVGVSRIGADNVYVTEDGGSTWNPITNPPATTLMPQRATKAGDLLYMTFANAEGPWNANTGALYRYNTKTKVLTNISPEALPYSGITVDASNPDIIMLSTINVYQQQVWEGGTEYGDKIYRSTNGGTSWTNLSLGNHLIADVTLHPWVGTHPQIHWAADIRIDPFNSERIMITSGNGLFMTENISAAKSTWTFQVNGLEEMVPLDLVSPTFGAPLISVIGDYDGFRHKYLDQSPLSKHNPSIGTTVTLDFAELNPRVVARAGSSAYYSNDNAKTWKVLPAPVTGAKDGSIAVGADGAAIVWSPNGQTAYTTSDKSTWTKSTGAPTGQRIIADRVNGQKFYIISSQKLFTSTDGGKNFAVNATNSSLSQIRKYRAAPGNEGDIWVPNGSMGLYRTVQTNNLTTFSKISAVLSCEAVGFGKAALGQTYPAIYIWGTVGYVEGVFRSDNQGVNWVRINDDANEFGGTGNANEVFGDPRVYGRVYMSTAGRGTVYGDLVDGPDANYVYDTEYLPTALSLLEMNKEPLFKLQQDKNTSSVRIVPEEKGSYEIYSTTGSLIAKSRCETSKEISGRLLHGMYILRFTSDTGKSASEKFIITR
jgi:xyloglucan-specific exo-beta-1,4-glucanase